MKQFKKMAKFRSLLRPSLGNKNSSHKVSRPLQNSQKIDLFHPARSDLYHWLLSLSWRKFLLLVTLFYFTLNIFFAFAYLSIGDGIANAEPGSFKDAFFFSIQTLSTVGYGSMYPQTFYAQLLMTIEVWMGLLLIAILTGLMFARFSRPTARVHFSQVAVVCSFDGIPTLMFRAANRRTNRILEAQIQVSLVRNEVTQEGHQLRRFYDLKLLRSRSPIFGLSWQVMHPIDQTSPLYGNCAEYLEQVEGEIWVTLTGLDETFSQTIHARHSYSSDEILWNMRFVDIFSRTSDGRYQIDLSRFSDVIPLN
ncbi:K channel inward rectifier conserved region 2 domain protein [Rippkaea orientalis PCC 8801]|uniref:K channel inward rectifier conserved region 2 domain protein n=1 Tax=Rippkaea orientalis (strain PCC 8801 / RF-1) TaxID=41431 RepID=B7JV57_RIPO1|nr:ion channel [Rippkaea orientalis]ACK66909.1 K channel inward rectifier conserved region 2 domain protein [Rippkaea orientalis PCC 8801]